jgi:hypothetical protein
MSNKNRDFLNRFDILWEMRLSGVAEQIETG